MTKRKAKPLSGVHIHAEPEKVGNRVLVVCSVCGGYGGIMMDDGDWKVCSRCQGGGREWKSE